MNILSTTERFMLNKNYDILILFFTFIIHLGNTSIKYEFITKHEINEDLGSFASNIVTQYFKHGQCVFIVTDKATSETFLSNFMLPLNISVIYIKTNKQNCSLQYFNYILEFGFSQYCSGYIVQLELPLCFLKMLQDVTTSSLYRQYPRLLFLPTEMNPRISMDLFSTKQLEFTPDVLVVDIEHFQNNVSKFKLLTIDWLSGKTVLAECEPQRCSQITVNLYLDKMQDLKGKEIRVSALHYAPYVLLKPVLDGSDISMANEFARLHNCSWKVTGVPQSEEWGELYDNGTGTGVLGAVLENKADVGLGGLFANLETFNFLSITSIYSQGRMTCLVPKPGELSSTFLPLKPFDIYTWLTILVTISITAVALYMCNKVVNYSFGKASRNVDRLNNFSTTVLLIFGVLLNQPPPPIRISSTLWFHLTFIQLMFLIIVTTYCSKLAATLTVPSYAKPIETPVDLANSGLLWGATHNYWAIDFMNSTLPHQKILLKNFRVLTKEQLKAKSFSGQFAFVLERLPTNYYAVHDYITEEAAEKLVLMKEELYTDLTVVVLRKGSPYTNSFNTFIDRVVSSGIFKYWEGVVVRKLFHPKIQHIVTHSLYPDFQRPTTIKIRNVSGAFILLIFGLSFAVIVFLIEMYKKTSFIIKFYGS